MDISVISSSDYFDSEYYTKNYPVPEDSDSAAHYAEIGWKLCYDPSENFSTAGYLLTHKGLIEKDINPLFHFEKYGDHIHRNFLSSFELINTTIIFNRYYYIDKHMGGEGSERDAIMDYLKRGWKYNLSVSDRHNMKEYLESLPDELQGCVPLLHFIAYECVWDAITADGAYLRNVEIIKNSNYFDEKYYRETYGIDKRLNAARHYYELGGNRMYDPSEHFSTSGYIYLNADALGKNALLHCESFGRAENRTRAANINPIKNPRSSIIRLSENTEFKISFAEENLYELVTKLSEAQQQDYIKRGDLFYFRALSDLRANFVEWLGIERDDKILIFGSGYGEIVSSIASKCGALVCFDINEIAMTINEVKNRDFDNIKYYTAANSEDFFNAFKNERFDYIVITEGFGNAKDYFPNEPDPQSILLNKSKSILTDNGKIVVACDNPYGIKFLNGSLQNEKSAYFETITGKDISNGSSTFTKRQLQDYADKSGFKFCKIYYPFPDYRFAFSIFTDKYTPKDGEITSPEYTWEKDKMWLFDENAAVSAAAERDCFDLFSNSYIAVMTNDTSDDGLLYVKYSNDRSEVLKIKTEVREMPNGERRVSKIPLSVYSERHIKKLGENFNRLSKSYNSKLFRFNRCEYSESRAEFEFITGKSLYGEVKEQIKNGEFEKAFSEFDKIFDLLMTDTVNFVSGRKFKSVFGNVDLTGDLKASPISNIDFILQNIIISGDGIYNVLDYEWTYDFPVPILYILFRSLMYLEIDLSGEMPKDFVSGFYERYKLTPALLSAFTKMENNFQNYVLSGHTPIRSMRQIGHTRPIRRSVQVLEDYGDGYLPQKNGSETFIDPKGIIRTKVYYEADIFKIGISFCDRKCIAKVLEISDSCNNAVQYSTNGTSVGSECFIYETNKPLIEIDKPDLICTQDMIANGTNYINVCIEVLPFTENIDKSIDLERVHINAQRPSFG